jgi:tetracycline 7-halogenase / FADH2 O2-dependent halogenase
MPGVPLSGLYDIAIAGSGFAGSLLAMIARRAGRSVVMLEKGTHPRFAIGESSTPLANLLLEELAVRYDLPRLKPLTKWGTWQQSYPRLACGLKRGFSFYHHIPGEQQVHGFDRERQLLVAASPNDIISDTHWYRAELDHFLVREAQEMGMDYLDQVMLVRMSESDDGVALEGERLGKAVAFRCRFLVDASGPRGFVHHALGLPEDVFPDFPPTQAIYTHFSGVAPFGATASQNLTDPPPYPVEDSAVHHVFDDGWMWVLRFNNGLTSAGAALTSSIADHLRLKEGGAAWTRLLDLLPSVREQFAGAKAELPFVHARRLSFLAGSMAGRRWAMLPSAAGFVDPLLSTGFPLTLLGIARLGEIITLDWDSPRFAQRLETYAAQTRKELLAAAQVIGALYATMGNFPLFASISFLYFAAASFAETARRLDKHALASSFLLCAHPVFGPACARLCRLAHQVRTEAESSDLRAAILQAIEPFNVAGLGDAQRRNWFPVDSCDLLRGAGKLGVTEDAIRSLISTVRISTGQLRLLP